LFRDLALVSRIDHAHFPTAHASARWGWFWGLLCVQYVLVVFLVDFGHVGIALFGLFLLFAREVLIFELWGLGTVLGVVVSELGDVLSGGFASVRESAVVVEFIGLVVVVVLGGGVFVGVMVLFVDVVFAFFLQRFIVEGLIGPCFISGVVLRFFPRRDIGLLTGLFVLVFGGLLFLCLIFIGFYFFGGGFWLVEIVLVLHSNIFLNVFVFQFSDFVSFLLVFDLVCFYCWFCVPTFIWGVSFCILLTMIVFLRGFF
jgi:hypothetical protein